jgi:hypothetical protein
MSLSLNAVVNLTTEELSDFQTSPTPPPPTPCFISPSSTPSLPADMNGVRYSSATPTPPLEDEDSSPLPLSMPCPCTTDSSEGCPFHQKNRTLFYIPETGEYLHPRLH